MKKIINGSILLIYSIVSFAQVKVISNQPSAGSKEILYFFDNIEINAEVLSLIDVNKIADINIVKSNAGEKNNAEKRIYIKSKNAKDFVFLSFADIKLKYVTTTTKPVLLLVNSNFIKNTKEFKIDDNIIYTVEVEQGADFDELKNMYANFAIVNIKTKNALQLKGERQIMLQGIPESSNPL